MRYNLVIQVYIFLSRHRFDNFLKFKYLCLILNKNTTTIT